MLARGLRIAAFCLTCQLGTASAEDVSCARRLESDFLRRLEAALSSDPFGQPEFARPACAEAATINYGIAALVSENASDIKAIACDVLSYCGRTKSCTTLQP